jgi:hypothetical protein
MKQMSGIAELLKLGRRRPLDFAARHRLMARAVEHHKVGVRENEIEAELLDAGASPTEAREISDRARAQAEAAAVRAISLPRSASLPVNYYFALGVTPRASLDRVRRAYRERAREIHPDRHVGEMSQATWSSLMTMASDAERILTDSDGRRAYDLLWLRRSREVTRGHATRKERRGDWETRLLWYMAELSDLEERLESQLRHAIELLEHGAAVDPAVYDLHSTVDEYEERVLNVRTQSQVAPPAFEDVAYRVRQETQRKDGLVAELRRGVAILPEGVYSVEERARGRNWVAEAGERLTRVHQAHRHFEVERLKATLAA